jgi:hypothetical protein
MSAVLQLKGCTAKLREDKDGSPYVTDNHNYIVDLYFTTPIEDAKVTAFLSSFLFYHIAELCSPYLLAGISLYIAVVHYRRCA